jgi:hypothetical protein
VIGWQMAQQRGGANNAHMLVVDSFWRQWGGGALKMKSYHKIVPQIVQKLPWKIGFSEKIFAQFEVQFDVQQIAPQIVPVFLCVRTGGRG